MCFFTLCGARRYASARRGRGGPVRAALRRAMVQCNCATTYEGGARHAAYDTGCSLSCSAVPVRAYGRRLRALGFFVCLLVLLPTVAHAEPSLEISNNPTGLTGNDRGYVVVNTNNQYDAALEVLGLWATKIQLDSSKFAKLSNESTGGEFYAFANSFFRLGSDGSTYHAYVGWAGDSYYQTLLVDVYGFGNVWAVETNADAISKAKRDYNIIRNGGSLGGGGVQGDYMVFSGGVYYSTSSWRQGLLADSTNADASTASYWGLKSASEYDSGSYPLVSGSLVIRVSVGILSEFMSRYPLTSYDYLLRVNSSNSISSSGTQFDVYAVERATGFGVEMGTNEVGPGGQYIRRVTGSSVGLIECSSTVYTYGDGVLTFAQARQRSYSSVSNLAITTLYNKRFFASGGSVQPPDNHWPDDGSPTTDPPEVPGPGEPVDDPTPPDLPTPYEPITDPDPPTYDPTPDPPANPVYDPNPTGTDYTPWLDYIIYLLKLINNNLTLQFGNLDGWLTSHCNHIRQQIRDMTVWLGSKLVNAINNGFVGFERWLQGTFSPWFLDALEARLSAQLVELEEYLQELFEWLADELDFSVSGGGYDDSTVVSWLKKIYLQLYQLGNRDDSSTQVKLDTIDYGSSLSRVSSAYGELSDNLPFCVPSDMQTVLGWVATSPVTPVFDVPWGFAGDSAFVHVDLSGWDGVAAGCRSMFFAIFCLELCKYTLHLWRLYRAAFVGVSV